MRLESSPRNSAEYIVPLVEALLDLRENYRNEKQWKEADAIRGILQRANIIVEDTEEGPRWQLKS